MKTFGWDLCHRCNYQCPYCGVWKDHPELDVILSPYEWGKIWDRIYDMYGKCRLYISGGEPSVYPNFYELISVISQKHFPDICTNLSWDVDKLINRFTPKDLRISATFHPSMAKFEDFFKKAVKAKEFLADKQIYYVCFPNQIKAMPERKEMFKAEGIKLIPLPLRGDGFTLNSEEEKKIIEELSPYKNAEKIEYQLQNTSPKGKLCRAGKDYAVIRVDGSVDRCSQYQNCSVGKITDKDFSLFSEYRKCEKNYCPIESQWIIDSKNDISLFLEMVRYYRLTNEFFKAEKFINDNEQFKNDDRARFELANIYVATNRIKQAIELFEILMKSKYVHVTIVALELIKLYKQKQEYKKAIETINMALERESKIEELSFQVKELYLQKVIFQRFIPDGEAALSTVREIKEKIENIKDIKFIKNIENVEKSRRQIAPYRCFFTWGMHYNCNYNCAYCYAPKPQDIIFTNNPNNVAKYEKLENIIDSWKYIYDKYGSSRIRLDGGEPSIYPNFFEIIKELSKIHRLQMNTNLSFDVNKFCDNFNPEAIRIDASLHCEYTKLETFVEKLKILKQKGYKLTVSYVGYPEFLENIPLAKKTIESMDIKFFVHPYSGFYEGRQYPQAYTEQDKTFLYDIDCESKMELVWRQERKSKYKDRDNINIGKKLSKEEIKKIQQEKQKRIEEKIKTGKYKLCEMGHMYARIYPNGNTYRCCSSDGNTYLGNLFDKSINLLERPEKCYEIDNCRCWRCMVPGEETRWLHTWLDDWETEV